MKEILGIVAVILTFVGYVPYIRDTLAGKTKPHIYTWFIWGLVTAIAFGLQVSAKAGPGAYTTLAAASICFVIFGFGMRQGRQLGPHATSRLAGAGWFGASLAGLVVDGHQRDQALEVPANCLHNAKH
jgi:hypothetical protein